MEDIAYLITEEYVNTDSEGNVIKRRSAKQTFCKIKKVTRREFYEAATQDIHPQYDMTISHRIDYNDEELVLYNDTLYNVARVYWKADEVSLTLVRDIGTLEKLEGILVMPDGSTVTFHDGKRLTVDY